MITMPRKVSTWLLNQDFGRQVFQFASDTFDALRALRKDQAAQDAAITALQAEMEAGGFAPGAHASTHLPVSGSDPLTVGSTADSFCVGNDSRLSDDRTAGGLRSATTVVSVSAATAPTSGQVLTATGGTAATWQDPSGSFSSDAFSFSSNAATLDISASADYRASNTLTADSVLTLTNGSDGRRGHIYVTQDSTGGWSLTFVVSGRTILRNEATYDLHPFDFPGSTTLYEYDYQTINGTAYVVIRKFPVHRLLLDSMIASAVFAGSSYMKLRAAYAGSAFRVRRSSDSTEQDIGFDATTGLVDTAALLSFCSGTNGFVTTLYDQSGNANDLTQATAANQPQIITTGALHTYPVNAVQPGDWQKNIFTFDGSNDNLTRADAFGISGNAAMTQGIAIASSTLAGQRWCHIGGTVNTSFVALGTDNATATARLLQWDSGASNLFNDPAAIDYPHGYVAYNDPGPGRQYVRQNGRQLWTSTPLPFLALTPNYSDLNAVLGSHASGTNFATISMNFWAVFDSTLEVGDMDRLERCIAAHLPTY